MNDIHQILAAFPALQNSPLVLGLINAGLIIYHILTHNRKPRVTPVKPRAANKPFLPQELYTPWSEAWFDQQNRTMKEFVKGKVVPNLLNFKTDLKHARADLKNLVNAFPMHPDADVLRERIFKIEQILNGLDLAGKLDSPA